jgi:putative copper export protein
MNALATLVAWVDLVSTTILAGAIISAALIAPASRTGRQAAHAAAYVLGGVLLLELILTALRLYPLSQEGGVAVVADVLNLTWGRLWILRVLGLAILISARRSSPRWLAVVAAFWLLLRSFQGHAGAHGTFPAIIDWLHLLAAVMWVGSLLQYALQPESAPVQTAVRLRTVSTAALVLLVPAGLYGAFLHVPSLSALLSSPYGRALSGKLLLAGVLIALGAANHFRYVPALQRGRSGAARTLFRIICVELAVGLLVLLLSALLGTLPMPHALPL